MTVSVKQLGGRIPVAEIILTRSLISILITKLTLDKAGIYPWGNRKGLLFIRGVFGTGALFCVFKALTLLPLATATIVQYTYPVFTALGASLFLEEKLTKNIVLGMAFGLAGVIIITEPSLIGQNTSTISISSYLIAITGAILTALAYICVRELSKSENNLVIVLYFPMISIPITFPFVFWNGVLPTISEFGWLISIGILTHIGQILITRGLSLLKAGIASSINYSQVIFASLWGILFFSEAISVKTLIGAIFVLISILISIKKNN